MDLRKRASIAPIKAAEINFGSEPQIKLGKKFDKLKFDDTFK